jgi:hypothetical protein
MPLAGRTQGGVVSGDRLHRQQLGRARQLGGGPGERGAERARVGGGGNCRIRIKGKRSRAAFAASTVNPAQILHFRSCESA